jgi:GLPGLI family protein
MFSQKSGKVVYRETIKIELPPDLPDEMKERIPKERSMNKELLFTADESSYKNGEMDEEDDQDIEAEGGGRRMRMRFGGGNNNDETYKNISDKTIADTRSLMGKDFLIEGDLPVYTWKMTGQKKQVLSYLVMEAKTMVDDSIELTAWFAPTIPVSTGPGLYHGLPGMILEASYDQGKRTIVATAVELAPVESGRIERPTKGKKITQEEFDKVRKEKMEEMRSQRGGRGVRFIRQGE